MAKWQLIISEPSYPIKILFSLDSLAFAEQNIHFQFHLHLPNLSVTFSKTWHKQSWAYLNNGYSTAFWYSKSFTRKRLMTVFGGAWVEHLWTLSIITPWLECLITTRLDLCYHKTLYCTRFGTIWPIHGAIISNCVLLADKSWTLWCSTKIISHYKFLAQGTSTFVTRLLLWWTLMLPFWIFS